MPSPHSPSRYFWPGTFLILAIAGMMVHGPMTQLADYHHFADARSWLGIPHAADVLSNIGFALIGTVGLVKLRHVNTPGRTGYALFFAALLLTALGSAWYHLAPDNARLVWDRLPIALACAGLLSAVWRDALQAGRWATPMLMALALGSVAWWRCTDLHGVGDLRPYLLLQLLPLVLIPLVQWQQRSAQAQRHAFLMAMALYAAAKVCELADHAIFDSMAALSGHTLKHLLATAAAAMVARGCFMQGQPQVSAKAPAKHPGRPH